MWAALGKGAWPSARWLFSAEKSQRGTQLTVAAVNEVDVQMSTSFSEGALGGMTCHPLQGWQILLGQSLGQFRSPRNQVGVHTPVQRKHMSAFTNTHHLWNPIISRPFYFLRKNWQGASKCQLLSWFLRVGQLRDGCVDWVWVEPKPSDLRGMMPIRMKIHRISLDQTGSLLSPGICWTSQITHIKLFGSTFP